MFCRSLFVLFRDLIINKILLLKKIDEVVVAHMNTLDDMRLRQLLRT